MESCCSVGIEFPSYMMKRSGDVLHNSLNILNTIELYTLEHVSYGKFDVAYFFYHSLLKSHCIVNRI